MIGAGEAAPEFTLRDQDGEEVSLSDYRGRKVLLGFYPLDFSPVCSAQLSIYQEGVVEWVHESPTPLEIPGATLIFDALS